MMDHGNDDHNIIDGVAWCDPLLTEEKEENIEKNKHNHDSPANTRRNCLETSFRCFCLPFAVLTSCITGCLCSRIFYANKPSQWTWKLTVAITTMRAITNNIIRKISVIRCITDRSIPTWLPSLPSGIRVILQQKDTTTNDGCPVAGEWILPSSHLQSSNSQLRINEGIPTNNILSRIILYLHGGGFALCTPGTHRGITMRLANKCKSAVYVPDYCRPPEHPYPEPIDDCVATYKWLLRFVVDGDPKRIVVGGDSAGGALAILMFQKLNEQNIGLPGGALLLSPWLDLEDRTSSSWEENRDFDYLSSELAHLFALSFVKNDESLLGMASATNQNLTNVPPLFVMCGDKELLRDQVITFIEKATEAGVDVERHIEAGMVHAFVAAFGEILDKEILDQWIESMANFIDRVTASNDS